MKFRGSAAETVFLMQKAITGSGRPASSPCPARGIVTIGMCSIRTEIIRTFHHWDKPIMEGFGSGTSEL